MTENQPYPQQPGQPGQPGQPYPQQGYYQQGPPPKKKHTLRNVLLIIGLLFILFVGGCIALIGGVANEVDNAIDEEIANDKPMEVAEGKAFERDGFSADAGWTVAPEQFGGATIKNLNVTLTDDQDTASGGRSALFTFRLYDGKSVVAEINCTSNEMQEGESSKMDCFSGDSEKLGNYDTIRVADAF